MADVVPSDKSHANQDGRPAESAALEREAQRLRAAGCRCMLKFDGRVMPLFRAEGIECVVAHQHYPEE